MRELVSYFVVSVVNVVLIPAAVHLEDLQELSELVEAVLVCIPNDFLDVDYSCIQA